MDAIARAGVVLDNYYGQSLCTPARATLMTGKYAHRLGIEYVTSESEITAFSNYSAMPIAEDLLPARLKALAGYRAYGVAKRNPSGMKLRPLPPPPSLSLRYGVGKWNLGHCATEYLPWSRGFEHFTGYASSGISYVTHVSRILKNLRESPSGT